MCSSNVCSNSVCSIGIFSIHGNGISCGLVRSVWFDANSHVAHGVQQPFYPSLRASSNAVYHFAKCCAIGSQALWSPVIHTQGMLVSMLLLLSCPPLIALQSAVSPGAGRTQAGGLNKFTQDSLLVVSKHLKLCYQHTLPTHADNCQIFSVRVSKNEQYGIGMSFKPCPLPSHPPQPSLWQSAVQAMHVSSAAHPQV